MIHTKCKSFSKCYISCRAHGLLPIIFLGIIFTFCENALAVEVGEPAAVPSSVTEAEPVKNTAPELAPASISDPEPEVESAPLPLEKTVPEVVKTPEPSVLAVIDNERDYLSEQIVTYTKSIDRFFGDDRYFQENNNSVIQLDMDQSLGAGGARSFVFSGKAKLDFPAATRRFQFVLESDANKKAAGDGKTDQPAIPQQAATAATADKYAASLRYEKSEESRWHFSTEGGANVQFPIDPFLRARGSYAIPLGEWRLKVAETLFWFNSTGLAETTQIDMEHVLSEPVLFRATSTATCHETTQICELSQAFTVFHTLNERTALLYQASILGLNKPQLEETAYVLLTRYRYRMHREWVFLEVSPQLIFPRTDDFRLNALLLLRLEFLLGGKP
jgi:hypothetical protein